MLLTQGLSRRPVYKLHILLMASNKIITQGFPHYAPHGTRENSYYESNLCVTHSREIFGIMVYFIKLTLITQSTNIIVYLFLIFAIMDTFFYMNYTSFTGTKLFPLCLKFLKNISVDLSLLICSNTVYVMFISSTVDEVCMTKLRQLPNEF